METQKLFQMLDLDDIPEVHPVKRFDKFWRSNLNDAGLFERASFKVGVCYPVLPWVVILEPERSSTDIDFIYRLCGTGFTSLVGQEFTGEKLGVIMPANAKAEMKAGLTKSLLSGKPKFTSADLPIEERKFIHVLRGVFPVSSDGETIDQLFTILAEPACSISAF
jgi:hypothetical protein